MRQLLLTLLVWLAALTLPATLTADTTDPALGRARALYDAREYASSSQIVDSCLMHWQNPDSAMLLPYLSLQADNFFELGVHTRAAQLLNRAIQIASASQRPAEEAKLCNSLFIIHFTTHNYDISAPLLQRSLEIYTSLNDAKGQRNILNNIGLLNYARADYPAALSYFERALRLSEADSVASAKILTNIAELCYIEGNYTAANSHLDEALGLIRYDNSTSEALQAWLNKALVLSRLGRRGEAEQILHKIDGSLGLRDQALMGDTYSQLADIKLTMGDSIAALRDMIRAQALSDSLKASQSDEQLRQLLVVYDTQRLAEHNNVLEMSVKRRTMLFYSSAALLLLLALFIAFLIAKARSDRRTNALILQQREQLIELERREHQHREKEFRDEIDHKNRQLTSFSIDAAAISELHKKVFDSLGSLRRNADPAAREVIDESLSLLENFNRVEVSEDFRLYFNEVHPDFIRRLSGRFPALTPTDLRLCSFLLLGMTTKEIAALTFREVRSVESSRLRLRKKLGLSADQSLHDFLQSI